MQAFFYNGAVRRRNLNIYIERNPISRADKKVTTIYF